MKLNHSLKLIALLIATPALARWETTTINKTFKNIYARNGVLVGIEEKTNLPYKWGSQLWKQLGDEEFLSLTTDGTTIAGIKLSDKCAYIFKSTSWQRLTPFLFLMFDQLVFSQGKLIGLAQQPLPLAYAWKNPLWEDNGSSWEAMGSKLFWNINAEGSIICGTQQSYESKEPNYVACKWDKNGWKNISTQQFQQIVTDGTTIYGIGRIPASHVFVWTGKTWNKLGAEKFTQIAANSNVLCGIQEKNQLILRWTGKKWIALDTKKFTQVATDGKTIYGLASDNEVYYWIN